MKPTNIQQKYFHSLTESSKVKTLADRLAIISRKYFQSEATEENNSAREKVKDYVDKVARLSELRNTKVTQEYLVRGNIFIHKIIKDPRIQQVINIKVEHNGRRGTRVKRYQICCGE